MRTTLNFPDAMIHDAKLRALHEGATLTDLLVEGLRMRLEKSSVLKVLPVSRAGGGLRAGTDWKSLRGGDADNEAYR